MIKTLISFYVYSDIFIFISLSVPPLLMGKEVYSFKMDNVNADTKRLAFAFSIITFTLLIVYINIYSGLWYVWSLVESLGNALA